MKKKPLTVTYYVGDKQVDRLSPEQLEKISDRLSETMSRYYSQNPQQYANIEDER